ncbi:MAG: SRPBCC family protein [Acidimicrobiales bacterium]
MTTQAVSSIRIDAPPEAVWPWIGQIKRHAEWSPKPYKVELVSGEPDAVGSRYRSVGWVPGEKEHGMDVVITEVVPGQRFALRSDDQQGSFTNSFDLRRADQGTEVTYELVFPPMKGLAALLVPVLFPLVGKADIRKRMRMLKAKVESAPQR